MAGFYPFNEEYRHLLKLGGLGKLKILRSRNWLQSPVSRPSSGCLPAALAGKHCLKAADISWSPEGSDKINGILEGQKRPLNS